MRVLLLCLSVCGIAYPLAGNAQAIHKCLAPDGVAYQSMPCASGAGDVVVASLGSAHAESVPRAEAPAATPGRREPGANSKRAFWRTSIAIGMSDDEVLNLPAWGRPSAIARSKANRVWYEEWIYRWRMGGTSRLSFANGRLTGVETAAEVEPVETQVSYTSH
ncbi:MAG: hypothetical protein ABI541_03640 [Betaproteobacteria bacterium]